MDEPQINEAFDEGVNFDTEEDPFAAPPEEDSADMDAFGSFTEEDQEPAPETEADYAAFEDEDEDNQGDEGGSLCGSSRGRSRAC